MSNLTDSENLDLNITSRLHFLEGQLALYKIEFSESGNNKYLEVMTELNNTIKLIKQLKHNTIYLSKELKNKI